ncbi:MAG: hypothetical protein A2498_08625 [Lentisphaerae bacterium RIFOXYC12_FULL_60_16]|nr:MAG: hypothetical protein A2498_08625 [Lentisphaerae bacterium RIFOXYC12_FULL_60_16]OGV77809.1 MAG: hypothetical protein A2340_00955 [Lentisphaerae bacterium RIFOXYB12_FULL_60_10]
MISTVTPGDFARSFGTTVDDFSDACRRLMEETNFRFRVLEGASRDAVVLQVLKKMDADRQKIGEEARTQAWFAGWAENLEAYRNSGHSREALVPRFIRDGQVIRLNGQYVQPENPRFELDYMTVFRTWLFGKYLAGCPSLHEFGCGTGLNLVLCADLFPAMELHGLDFVQSAVDLVHAIGVAEGRRLQGHLFDMRHPDRNVRLKPGSGVLTFGAIEQLAGDFEAFLDYLLDVRPAVCIHVEPTVEVYDEDILFDYLAARFHRQRGYTRGLLPRLELLESERRIRILKRKRLGFGSLMMEGYTCMVWQPV